MSVAAQPLTGLFVADPIHSSFGFAVKHMGLATFRGTFDQVEARLDATGDAPVLEGAAAVEGISIRTPDQFRAHVLAEDFFDAEKHPDITCRSTEVSREGSTWTVAGDLTIKGVAKPVTVEFEHTGAARDPFGNLRIGFEGEATVNRKDWGLTWNAALETGGVLVSDKIKLELDVSAIRNG